LLLSLLLKGIGAVEKKRRDWISTTCDIPVTRKSKLMRERKPDEGQKTHFELLSDCSKGSFLAILVDDSKREGSYLPSAWHS
jgi:hypothetical protein